jgi:diaminopropionate ammonia-lyase
VTGEGREETVAPSVSVVQNSAAATYVAEFVDDPSALALHQRLPGYEASPLVRCATIARLLGVREVWVKDESSRLGLPAFKVLGASYAIYTTLVERLGCEPAWSTVDDLRRALARLRPLTLVAATDGNHGRAVARMAALLGLDASIYVPYGTARTRIGAIEDEGAAVVVVSGDYDAAVRQAAEAGRRSDAVVISDMSNDPKDATAQRVIDGYLTIFKEVSATLEQGGAGDPTVVVVPVGVGALTAATIRYYKRERRTSAPKILGIEPESANCVYESLLVGRRITVPGPHPSVMAGLNCGTPSAAAWPLIAGGLDACLGISDCWALNGVRMLAEVGLEAGESGAAPLGGLLGLVTQHKRSKAQALGLTSNASVLVVMTEGPTDADAWSRIVGRRPITAPPLPCVS